MPTVAFSALSNFNFMHQMIHAAYHCHCSQEIMQMGHTVYIITISWYILLKFFSVW